MKTCEVVENDVKCENKHRSKGMCEKHYRRSWKHGDPLKVMVVYEKREHEAWCPTCKAWLPKSEFSQSSARPNGLQARCKSCHSDAWLAQRFNLTREQWNQMLADQGGGCAICGSTEPYGRGSWHVDHDHKCCPESGKSCGECVRSLLCQGCNRGMGYFSDDPDRLLAAAAYLLSDSNIQTPTTREVPAV